MVSGDPKPKSYAPFVSARYPAEGKAPAKPDWRILVHRKHVAKWNELGERCGESNAEELWKHLAFRPDQPPQLGTVTPMKGKHNASVDGMSRVYHYEVSGAARLDYRFNSAFDSGDQGDVHPIVQIVSIDFGSH